MRKQIFVLLTLLFLPSPFASAQPVPCDGKTGKEIGDCVEAAYPDRLAAGVSLETRKANMEFLRNRLIETARCAGLDVGLNLKRGGPSISYDFVVWRRPGKPDNGVDIAGGYDDTSETLKLGWFVYSKERNYGHPFFKAYGPVSCIVEPVDDPPDPSTDPKPSVDLEPIHRQIAALTAALAVLDSRITNEEAARRTADTELGTAVMEIGSRHIPTMCGARGPLGIPVRCEIR